jgi:hypothetical protein
MQGGTLPTFVAASLVGLFAVVPSCKQPVPQQTSGPSQATCTVLPTGYSWYSMGFMSVSVDGSAVGEFQFGVDGSTSFAFPCSYGSHSFLFKTNAGLPGTPPASHQCSGTFAVSATQTKFTPSMNVTQSGTTCGLLG